MNKISLQHVLAAANTIKGYADTTPLIPSVLAPKIVGHELLMKMEIMQPIGAFKLRGAINAVFNLGADVKGVTACSTGNHGRAVAYAAKLRGMKAVICMSNLVPEAKVEGIKALGGDVRIIGKSQDEAMVESQRLVKAEGLIEISPFDDPFVIAGQGTIGLEILAARSDVETLLIPLSGGGLAAGVAMAAKAINPKIRCIGISMHRGAAMAASLKAGEPVVVPEYPSLADSLGGGIGLENKLSFALCQAHLDDVVLVSESEIRDAMQAVYYEERIIAEGASVVGFAAIMSGKVKLNGTAATIITGRNLDMAQFHRIMAGEDVWLGDLKIEGKQYGG